MVNHPNRSEQRPTHTPGPWRIFITANQVPIITSDRGDVAVTLANGNNAGGIEEANARLIAAAPELLAALKAIYYSFDANARAIAKAAIDKAEGR